MSNSVPVWQGFHLENVVRTLWLNATSPQDRQRCIWTCNPWATATGPKSVVENGVRKWISDCLILLDVKGDPV
jgi:hypothetical protein